MYAYRSFPAVRTLALGLLLSLALLLTVRPAAAQHGNADIVDTAVAAGSFETLAAALTEAGLVATLKGDGPFTVFAPTDEAFAKLPHGTVESLLKPENRAQLVAILTYHVVPARVPASQVVDLDAAPTVNGQRLAIETSSSGVFVDGVNVVQTDINASNGIIHVIDEVLMPETATIPEIAQDAGQFKTLLAAVTAAGLAETLMGEGPFTVFAPTDAAFNKLPNGTVSELLKPENRNQLTTILTYHVVSGRAFAEDVLADSPLTTLAGDVLRARASGGNVFVNDARVLAPNLDAANGVIHVIDSVLLPNTTTGDMGPADLIRYAINRGVPMYNAGNAEACAAVYATTANALLAMNDVPADAKRALRMALAESDRFHDADRQAWALRHGLNDAATALDRRPMRTTAARH